MRHVTGPMDLVLSPILHRAMMCAVSALSGRAGKGKRDAGGLWGRTAKVGPFYWPWAALGTDCRDAPIDPKQNVGGQGFGTPLPVCAIPFAYLRRGVGRITKTGDITHVEGREMSGHVLQSGSFVSIHPEKRAWLWESGNINFVFVSLILRSSIGYA
ncbi:hypothetical protein PAAG_06186 [Paracoccidioides lutzii Pb01]|uniref:Uncharacterized protein n=1 Tax=Paracoccidioides lutzii (strain ATCC MYA-826 / Pb01) TaxID=502779 RepID=C1H676_PARBA|nr:hypothetical protein PAAG_06186 [Paracoccidioides lutzii Pb01]EEH35139.2 hypothetical protein PAAG_06186 [Paracoccidioides lutzii Pb01]